MLALSYDEATFNLKLFKRIGCSYTSKKTKNTMYLSRRSVVYRNNKDFKILAIQQGRLRPNLKPIKSYLKQSYNHTALNLPTLLRYCLYFEIFI
jgi:hypothetical protein